MARFHARWRRNYLVNQLNRVRLAGHVRPAFSPERLFLAPNGWFAVGQVVRIAVFPVRRIARRPEFVRAENPPLLTGARHAQNQGHAHTGSLEVRDAYAVDSAFQSDAALFVLYRVDAVIIDHPLVIDVQLGTIVGAKQEAVLARIVDIEIAGVIDREPLEAVGDAREAFQKIARWKKE